MNIQVNKAFTLVELIVVITILAILSTVAFISFQGYSSNSRDSVRIADMTSIEKGLNIILTTTSQLPTPGNYINITSSGTTILHQGNVDRAILGAIGVNGAGKDPIDSTYYTYSTNISQNKYQLLGYLENGENISFNQNTYANLSERYPQLIGDELGILVNSVTREPIQGNGSNVDIVNTTNEYTVYIDNSDEGILTGTGSELVKVSSYHQTFTSCKNIIDTYGFGIQSGIYNITPTGDVDIQAYCDMENDNGGWTLVTPSMIQEINYSITSTITTDINGGLIYELSDILRGCGSTESKQEMRLPSQIDWSHIRYQQDFTGAASCWEIFGRKKGAYIYDINIIPYDSGIDTIQNQIRMGGNSAVLYDGANARCDNSTVNFWHDNHGTDLRSAEVILRREDTNIPSYLSTGLSCVYPGTTFEYSNIYIK